MEKLTEAVEELPGIPQGEAADPEENEDGDCPEHVPQYVPVPDFSCHSVARAGNGKPDGTKKAPSSKSIDDQDLAQSDATCRDLAMVSPG